MYDYKPTRFMTAVFVVVILVSVPFVLLWKIWRYLFGR